MSATLNRSIYDALWRQLQLMTTMDIGLHGSETVLLSLQDFVSRAEELRRRMAIKSRGNHSSGEKGARVEIVNWRKHGDEESYCRVEVFAADDIAKTTSLIEEEHCVRIDAEDEGNYDATYYVNDDITITDGDIMISHDGRSFRIGVVSVDEK